VLDLSGHLAAALPANYPESPDSCLWVQFSIAVNGLQMPICGAYIPLIKLAHHDLTQPDRLVPKMAFHASPPVPGLVQERFSPTGGDNWTFTFRQGGGNPAIIFAGYRSIPRFGLLIEDLVVQTEHREDSGQFIGLLV